ncbi:tRNA (adenosine(37)-N6)-dimethylallyltransferase MiaA [Patescibacteria group bacterium]|nr:tRNA (adenosine(37)-N6)-dimethylallyltransferase MiaA [Patescibacteria group bacterium]MBU4116064.1 tRNA (adenosine(37)-N6)-dimethylallyltransferase MiaA [Patescibacteria group bacterium]
MFHKTIVFRKKQKIIVILGPTSSGKSDLAVKLAKKFDGEIISADSRQVYKGMDLGTGKINKKKMCRIQHHLLDIVSPKKQFTVVDFKKMAEKKINEILKRNKIPIICGGTGFYIDSVVNNVDFPFVRPNKKLRKELEKKSAEELFKILKKLDPARAKNIDSKNKRRLIRAIEIAKMQISADKKPQINADKNHYGFLQIGIKTGNKKLRKLIHKRLIKRIKNGMINEVKKLHKNGVSWKRLDDFGLEYRFVSRYLRGLLSKDEMIEQLETKIWQYSRRQKTWFKRDKRIKWFELGDYKKIDREIQKFLR